jgi:NAD-dependent deacetylase
VDSVVVLTGAGISAESGIRTFRDSDGLWENHRIEAVATPQAFAENPAVVHRFYNARRQQLRSAEVQVNAAHKALARFESEYDGTVLVVTQNIDDLHERAGTRSLIHMHGELNKSRCVVCDDISICADQLSTADCCVRCTSVGSLRPHIVWFGEVPFAMEAIAAAISACRYFISIGTSGNVYPAAGFAQLASSVGATTIELNLEASNTPGGFDETYHGLASEVVPALVERFLA